MQTIADRIIILWGWRRFFLALFLGALSALALPPFGAFPVLWITFTLFVWLIDGAVGSANAGFLRRLLPAAFIGWAFGFGYFLAGLWWIGAAFLVDADQFAWLMPFAVVAAPAGLALFWAFGAALARAFWPEGWPRILVFAIAMALAEWLRGHVLTGFPWNAVGYALAREPVMMQPASLFGLWGLTLAAFVIFAAPAVLADRRGAGRFVFVGLALVLLAADAGYGAYVLSGATDATVPKVHIRIVQPNVDERDKWKAGQGDALLKRYLEMSDGTTAPDRSGVGSATHVIWPESAFPFLLTERPDALAAIAALLPEGTTLVTGAARAERGVGAAPVQYFNSIYVIDDKGEITAAYDKVRLVPFGEYLPLAGFFDALGIRQLIEVPGGFSAGTRRVTLPIPGAPPVGPLICYEIIFPGAVVDPDNRPGWLLNLTNDAWFGDTPGPYQHLLQARLRAIEEGLPVVRAANTGISAIIDSYGRVRQSLGLGSAGLVDGDLPVSLPPTLYARFGDFVFLGLMIAAALAAGWGQLTSKLKRN